MFVRIALAAALALTGCTGMASQPVVSADTAPDMAEWFAACEDWDKWDKAAPPFLVHGNTYHVGTCGISAILVTDPRGHILIDSGTQEGAKIVLANIRALGFRPEDIKFVLSSHEHYDHVGGMAAIQQATGARVIAATDVAANVLRSGEDSDEDPQSGDHAPFAPVPNVEVMESLTVDTGDLILTLVPTPGHTPGAASWQWESCDEAGGCRMIVYADSLSPVSSDDYRFSDHPAYLGYYRDSLARVAALECDMLLTPHPSASRMRDKLAAGDLASGMNCREFSASVTARLDSRLAQEAAPK